jgi:hypothetical protein
MQSGSPYSDYDGASEYNDQASHIEQNYADTATTEKHTKRKVDGISISLFIFCSILLLCALGFGITSIVFSDIAAKQGLYNPAWIADSICGCVLALVGIIGIASGIPLIRIYALPIVVTSTLAIVFFVIGLSIARIKKIAIARSSGEKFLPNTECMREDFLHLF